MRIGASLGAVSSTITGVGQTFDFYISPTGVDTNLGTVASPWAITTFMSVSPNFSKLSGKRIGFLPGTYNIAGTSGVAGATFVHNPAVNYQNNPGGCGSYAALTIPSGPNVSTPTYVGTSDATGHYSPRTATIFVAAGEIAGTNKWGNGIIGSGEDFPSAAYVTIDGLRINANNMDCVGPDGNEGAHVIFFQSATGSFTTSGNVPGPTVQNCEVWGIQATDNGGNDALVWFQNFSGCLLHNSYLHDTNKANDISHCHGFECYGCQGVVIEYCTFYNCTGGAMEPKEGNANIIARYNYVYSCATTASGNYAVFQAWDGAEGNPNNPNIPYQIHHNIVDTCGRVTFGESNNAGHAMQVQWYNNTIYNSGAVILSAISGAVMMHYDNLYVKVSGSNSGQVTLSSGGVSPLAYDAFYNVAGGSYTGVISGVTETTGLQTGVDPQFIPGTASITSGGGPGQFALQGTSALLNAGFTGGTSGGTPCNIGAWDGVVAQVGADFKQSGPWP